MVASPELTISPTPNSPPVPISPPAGRPYTYDNYARLTRESDGCQLLEGEIIELPAPTPDHQFVIARLGSRLAIHVEDNELGAVLFAPIDVHLSENDTPQPDMIFIARDRLQIIGDKKIEGAPDLVIEVLSPSTAYYDLRTKKRIYAEAGVKEYWIVDAIERSVEIYDIQDKELQLSARLEGDAKIESKLLPGFALPVRTVFA